MMRNSINVQRGFSLVELMVGVAIGLIAMLVVFQVLSVWDASRRTTNAGSSAQVAGTVALYNLEHDIRIAGWGFGSNPGKAVGSGGCLDVNVYNSANPSLTTFNLVPVQITHTVGSPDAITILYGGSALLSDMQAFVNSSAIGKKTLSNTGFQAEDLVVVADPGGTCDLVQVTGWLNAVSNPPNQDDSTTFYHDPASGPNSVTGHAYTYNRPGGTIGAYNSGNLFNLGSTSDSTGKYLPVYKKWYVKAGGTLAWMDLWGGSAAADVTEGIVDMKVQYGIDGVDGTAPDNNISATEWTASSPVVSDPSNHDWSKVLAVRIALIARSQKYEKPDPTAGCNATTTLPTWSGATVPATSPTSVTAAPFVMTDVNGAAPALSNGPNDWRCYRYRVYEKVIPIRNAIWGTT